MDNKPAEKQEKRWVRGKFALEVALPKNHNPVFKPTEALLRGRYDASKVAGFSASEELGALFREFPIINGLHIEIDTVNRTLRIYDPYRETEKGREQWKRLSVLLEQVPVVGAFGMEPYEEYKLEGEKVTDDRIKDWMYTCTKWVENGKATPLVGKDYAAWPAHASLSTMPGTRTANRFNLVGWNKRELVES